MRRVPFSIHFKERGNDMSELYDKVTKKDLYNNSNISRLTAYLLFLSNEETDSSILPKPMNPEEEEVYKLCLLNGPASAAAGATKADASNIGANLGEENDNSEDWGDALGGGAVASGEKRLVTGGTVYDALNNFEPEGAVASDNDKAVSGSDVYNEVRPAADGEYVKTDSTTAENLTALDEKTHDIDEAVKKFYKIFPSLALDGTAEGYVKAFKDFVAKMSGPFTLTKVCDDWYTITREQWHGWVDFPTTGVSTGTKGGDNAGLVCVPSTNEVAERDDYAGNPLFACIDCVWSIDATTLEPVIVAICGVTGGFERYNAAKFVGVLQQSGYLYVKDVDANTYRKGYASYFLEDIKPDPLPEAVRTDGTIRPWVLHAKYLNHTVDGKLTSYSGVIPTAYSISHNTVHTLAAATGTGFSGMCWCDVSFLQIMFHIKYANLSADGILQGCLANNYNAEAAVSETGVKRILLTASAAANFEVGMGVLLGTSNDRGNAACYSISTNAGCIITAIEDVTVEGTAYKAIYVDVSSDFDTTAGSTYITTFHWPNGSCDNVKGNDGSPKNPGSGKYPAKLQGIEFSLGGWEVIADTIVKYYQDSDDAYKVQMYFAERTAHQSTGVTENYKASGVELDQPASSSWNYIRHKTQGRGGVLMPDAYGNASNTTHYKDAIYLLAATTGEKEVICFGYLNGGASYYGLSCAYCGVALSVAYWHIVSRSSPNGNRGEFVAAA